MTEEAKAQAIKEREERSLIFRESITTQRSAEDIQKVLDHKAKYEFEM